MAVLGVHAHLHGRCRRVGFAGRPGCGRSRRIRFGEAQTGRRHSTPRQPRTGRCRRPCPPRRPGVSADSRRADQTPGSSGSCCANGVATDSRADLGPHRLHLTRPPRTSPGCQASQVASSAQPIRERPMVTRAPSPRAPARPAAGDRGHPRSVQSGCWTGLGLVLVLVRCLPMWKPMPAARNTAPAPASP